MPRTRRRPESGSPDGRAGREPSVLPPLHRPGVSPRTRPIGRLDGDMAREMQPGHDALPAPSPDVVSRRLGDEIVLVHLQTNRIFSLSPTGARLWELLSAGRSRPEIERQLREEYDVSPEAVSAEVSSLVTMLEAEALVERG